MLESVKITSGNSKKKLILHHIIIKLRAYKLKHGMHEHIYKYMYEFRVLNAKGHDNHVRSQKGRMFEQSQEGI